MSSCNSLSLSLSLSYASEPSTPPHYSMHRHQLLPYSQTLTLKLLSNSFRTLACLSCKCKPVGHQPVRISNLRTCLLFPQQVHTKQTNRRTHARGDTLERSKKRNNTALQSKSSLGSKWQNRRPRSETNGGSTHSPSVTSANCVVLPCNLSPLDLAIAPFTPPIVSVFLSTFETSLLP